MKKWTCVFFALMMLVAIFVQPVSAATMDFSVSASASELSVGEEMSLSVSVSSSDLCDSFGVILSYDTSVFEVTGGSCSASYSQNGESMIAAKNFSRATGKEGFAVSFLEAVVYSGSVGSVTLRIKDGAAPGAATISFKTSCRLGAGSVSASCNSVQVTIVNKTAETTAPTEPSTEPSTEAPTVAPTEEATVPPTEHQHTFSNKWMTDKNKHWHECTTCGEKKDVANHKPGPEATETEHQRCTVCNYVIKPALTHEHEFGTEWVHSVNQHWHECECGEKSDLAAHVWYNNTCKICGTKAKAPSQGTTNVPPLPTQTEPQQTEGTEPTQIPTPANDSVWGIGGLILVGVVVLITAVYFFIAKKRQ